MNEPFLIDPAQVCAATEITPAHCEASTVGIKPGYWPAQVSVEGVISVKVVAHFDADHDLMFMEYAGPSGVLRIIND